MQIFAPEKVRVMGDGYTLYRVRFTSLYALYEYLKSDPQTNNRVFYRLHSVLGEESFAGKPYSKAVEDLVSTVDYGYKEFLKLEKSINGAKLIRTNEYRTVKTLAGGHLNIVDYSKGSPLCYETLEKVRKPKFVRIYILLAYRWNTTKSEVFNRAIIITNIVKALENFGYNVELNTFELSVCHDELFYAIVSVKKHSERINLERLYKILCHVEFLRRISFRLLETTNVTDYEWEDGYGAACQEDFCRAFLKLNKDDIYFDQPKELGIRGYDLADDFEAVINHLNLNDKIDVKKAKEEFRNNVRKLKKEQ